MAAEGLLLGRVGGGLFCDWVRVVSWLDEAPFKPSVGRLWGNSITNATGVAVERCGVLSWLDRVPSTPSVAVGGLCGDSTTDAAGVIVERCGVGVVYTLLGFGSLAGKGDCNFGTCRCTCQSSSS